MRVPVVLGLVLGLVAAFAHAPDSWASLQLVQPDQNVAATFRGHGGYSSDGLGQVDVGGTIQAQVPAGSTVVRAYLYGTYVQSAAPVVPDDTTIDVHGTNVVVWVLPQSTSEFTTTRGDVTAIVAAKVGSLGGTFDFAVNTDPGE